MPSYAFVFPEAIVQVSAANMALQSVSYATSLTVDETPIPLEDASIAFKRVRMALDSTWVEDDIRIIRQTPGPFSVVVTWTNEDDLRLRSEVVQNAALTAVSLRGSLEGGAETYSLTFEGLSR